MQSSKNAPNGKVAYVFPPRRTKKSKASQRGGILNGEASCCKPWKYDIRMQCHLRNSIDLRGSE